MSAPAGRLSAHLDALRERGEKALVTFVTGGDPSLAALPAILGALADGGADVIEVGVPFSDPIADGPVIQASSFRALEGGATLRGVLGALRGFDRVPVVLMGYMNPVLAYGAETFVRDAVSAGVAGTILCDAIPDEASEWLALSRANGLDTVFLAAPTSTDARLDLACASSTGFVYAVSRTGVTGSGTELPPEAARLVERLRTRTSRPVLVGFGVSTPDHVRSICSVADGAVVGSSLVDLLHREGLEALCERVRELKAATR